jgi:hypothetical protein
MVDVRETPGVARMACWSGSSPARCILIQVVVTLPDMSDRLFIAVNSCYVRCTDDG